MNDRSKQLLRNHKDAVSKSSSVLAEIESSTKTNKENKDDKLSK